MHRTASTERHVRSRRRGLVAGLKCLWLALQVAPAVLLASGVMAVVGFVLSQLNLALLHLMLRQPLLGTRHVWEEWFSAACVLVSVGWGGWKMLGWWWNDLKLGPDDDVREMALALEAHCRAARERNSS